MGTQLASVRVAQVRGPGFELSHLELFEEGFPLDPLFDRFTVVVAFEDVGHVVVVHWHH